MSLPKADVSLAESCPDTSCKALSKPFLQHLRRVLPLGIQYKTLGKAIHPSPPPHLWDICTTAPPPLGSSTPPFICEICALVPAVPICSQVSPARAIRGPWLAPCPSPDLPPTQSPALGAPPPWPPSPLATATPLPPWPAGPPGPPPRPPAPALPTASTARSPRR